MNTPTLAPVVAKLCKPCRDCGTPVLHLGGSTLADPTKCAGNAAQSIRCADSPSGFHRWAK